MGFDELPAREFPTKKERGTFEADVEAKLAAFVNVLALLLLLLGLLFAGVVGVARAVG